MRRVWFVVLVLALGLILGACGDDDGGSGGGSGGGGGTGDGGTGGGGSSGGGGAVVSGDCGQTAEGDLDRTVDRAGGQLRLCIRESEVRLWGLTDKGKADPGFAKGDADIYFSARGGDEQMLNGLLLKGSPEQGYGTRMIGHGGAGVAAARIVLDGTEISLAP